MGAHDTLTHSVRTAEIGALAGSFANSVVQARLAVACIVAADLASHLVHVAQHAIGHLPAQIVHRHAIAGAATIAALHSKV